MPTIIYFIEKGKFGIYTFGQMPFEKYCTKLASIADRMSKADTGFD